MANFDIAENFIGGHGCDVIRIAVAETRGEAFGKLFSYLLSSFEREGVPLDQFLNGLVYALADRKAFNKTDKGKALDEVVKFIEKAREAAEQFRELNEAATLPKFHVGQRVMALCEPCEGEEDSADHGEIVGFKLMRSPTNNEKAWYYCIRFDTINQIEDVLESSVVLEVSQP